MFKHQGNARLVQIKQLYGKRGDPERLHGSRSIPSAPGSGMKEDGSSHDGTAPLLGQVLKEGQRRVSASISST